MSIGSASCFEKNSEAQTRTIATSATSFSATVVISGASFIPMLAYPKMPLVLESRNFTSGKDARARSKTTLRTERQQWRSRQRGRADRPRKSGSQEPGCSKRKGRSCSVLVFICGSDSYSATCGATYGGSDYCSETWSEWQDLNLRPPRPER